MLVEGVCDGAKITAHRATSRFSSVLSAPPVRYGRNAPRSGDMAFLHGFATLRKPAVFQVRVRSRMHKATVVPELDGECFYGNISAAVPL